MKKPFDMLSDEDRRATFWARGVGWILPVGGLPLSGAQICTLGRAWFESASGHMTAKELHELLGKMIEDGFGNTDVLFDTEAREWPCHMVPVTDAFCQDEPRRHIALSSNA